MLGAVIAVAALVGSRAEGDRATAFGGVGLILAGCALFAASRNAGRTHIAVWVSALLVLTAADFAFHFRVPGGASGPAATALLGLAILIAVSRRSFVAFEVLTIIGGSIGTLGLLYNIFGGDPVPGIGPMELRYAAGVVLLTAGTYCLRRDAGLMSLLVSEGDAGFIARRLAVPLLLLPFWFAWLGVLAQRAGWLQMEATRAVIALAGALVFGGVLTGTAALLRRVESERRRAESAVRESRELLQAIIDNAPAVIYVKDLAGRYLLVNRRFEEMFHVPADAVLGRSDKQLFSPDVAEAIHEVDRRVLATDAAVTEEETVPQSDGTHSYLSVKAPLRDDGGAAYALFGISTDVTERRRAEEALHATDERARLIFESALDAIITLDEKGAITGWNPQAEAVFGWPSAEATGRPFFDTVIAEGDREKVRGALAPQRTAAYAPLLNQRVEITALHRAGREIPVELAITPIHVGGVLSFAAFARDLTRSRRAEQALRESERRVRTVIDLVPHYIFAKDRDGRFLFVNRAFAESHGLTQEQIVGRLDREIIPDLGQYELYRRDDLEVIDSGTSKFVAAEHRTDFTGRVQIMQTTKIPFSSPDTGQTAVLGVSVDITAQKQAEEKMAWLASFPEADPNPVVEIALSSAAVHYANPAALALFPNLRGGLRHPFLIGVEACAEAMIRGQADLSRREIMVENRYYSQIFHLLPEAERLRIYSIDISDRTRAETALKRQGAELTFILNAVPALVFYKDEELRYRRVNERMLELGGRPREEIKGKTDTELEWPHSPEYLAAEQAVISTGEARRGLVEAFASLDGVRWYLADLLPHRDQSGRVRGVIGIAVDITARKLAVEELEAAEAKFRCLVEQSLVGIYIIQGDHFAYVNPKMCEIHGRSEEELISRPVSDLIYEEDREIVRENVRRRLANETLSINYRIRTRRGDGRLINVEVHGARTEYNGRPAILGTLLDITERMQAEHEVQRLNAELEQRVKDRTAQLEAANQELEAFSYSVSHDLRAPLRAVSGFSQAVIEDYGSTLPEDGQRYLRTIQEGARQMGQLIDDLLTFSRLSRMPLQRRSADFEALVRDCLQELEPEQRGRAIDLHVADLPAAEVDPALFKQVWINLLANALKYSRGRNPAVIRIGSTIEDGEVVYWVQDNGAGFDMRFAGKLFGVFQRMHRAEEYEGTGVGLAIVARIIHRHGGRVWAEAEVDRGATFSFTIGAKG